MPQKSHVPLKLHFQTKDSCTLGRHNRRVARTLTETYFIPFVVNYDFQVSFPVMYVTNCGVVGKGLNAELISAPLGLRQQDSNLGNSET